MKNKLRRDLIKQRLKEELRSCKLAFTEIGKKIGINPSLLSQYCNTSKMPSLATLSLICEAIDADANYILGLVD